MFSSSSSWGGQGTQWWDNDAAFSASVQVNSLVLDPSWTVNQSHTIYLDPSVAVTTVGYSQLTCPSSTIQPAADASLALVGSTTDITSGSVWSAGSIDGGTLLIDNGAVQVNPSATLGNSITADTFVHVSGGEINYSGSAAFNLDTSGHITIDNGGYFLAQLNPVPQGGAIQTIASALGNINPITITRGTFEAAAGAIKVVSQQSITVNGAAGILFVDSNVTLRVTGGVSASAGYIKLQGGQITAPTTIDLVGTGLTLTGSSTLETVGDSASYHYSQINGNLTEGTAANVWIGYHLSGIGFSSSYGPNLFVNGNATLNGTLTVGVYTFGNPRPVVGLVSAYLSSNGSVTFGSASALAFDAEGPGCTQSGDEMLIVDCTPGSGTTNEPASAPAGYTLGLENNNQQLWATAD
jgi:hypothetical protein